MPASVRLLYFNNVDFNNGRVWNSTHVSQSVFEGHSAKVSLKAAMLSNLDGHNNVAEEIGRSLLNYGRRMTPAETFSRIDAVTTDDIKATAYKFFNDKDHALAAVGGIHELPDYTWFRRHSYWLRY